MLNQFEWRCNVDFLDEVSERDSIGARALDYTEWEHIEKAILRSCKWIKAAWIDHTCIFEVHTETNKMDLASARLAQARCAAMRVILRYRKLAQSKANLARRAKRPH